MRPRVSVIIPTYNRGSIVTRAADSVLSQDFEDFEVIVVDDGSTDDTAETLSTYEARIRRKGDGFVKLRILRQENQGVCAARNAGIFASKGEWIAFLDSDDEWLPGETLSPDARGGGSRRRFAFIQRTLS